jgi:xanthine dehydrogenase YagR molybdenum-binding subunit
VELRIRNHTGEDPASGRPFSSKHLLDCYRIGAEAFGWPRRTPAPRSMRDGRWLIGLGMATATYPGYRLQASARARLLADGTAVVESATQDLGTGTYTTMTQVAAETLGIAPERVTFSLGDSSYPPAPTAGGSNTTASLSPAVLHACTLVRDEALKLAAADPASPLHGLAPAQVASGGGRLSARSDPARGESYEEILRRAGRPHLEACVGASPFKPEEQQQAMQSQGKPGGKTINAPCIPVKGMEAVDGDMERYAFQSFGAQFVEVRVDEALGTVRVARVTSVQDVGRVMNHKTARSQVIGGIVFGLGMALAEETFYDPSTGRPVTRNLADYHIPCNADVPEIEVRFIDEPDPRFNPLGARGLGEIGITGVAAAVANAVYHATDRRVRDLPITPDKVRG